MSFTNHSSFGALPPQSMAMSDIRLHDDDDDILMDYEDDIPAAPPAAHANGDETMMLDFEGAPAAAASEPAEEELMVPERVHIRGVDNLNTAQVKEYVSDYYPTHIVRVEWIDDTSLNVVYENPAEAIAALAAISDLDSPEEFPLLTLRQTKPFSKSPDSRLTARISKPSDRKAPGARDRSRYYLFHPEEDHAEQERRERPRQRSRQRSRNTDRSRDRGDYSRRQYDSREDGARRRDAEQYAEDMYDDAGTTKPDSHSRSPLRRSRSPPRRSRSPPRRSRSPARRSRSPPRRRRSYSRSRSPPRRRRSPHEDLFPVRRRSRSPRLRGVELFPSRNARSRSGSRQSRELFPERNHGSRAAMDNFSPPPQKELFPTRAQPKELFHTRAQPKELFPSHEPKELLPTHSTLLSSSHPNTHIRQQPSRPKTLAERITIPKSFADRVSFPPSTSPSPTLIAGASDDVFAQKMMSSKGEELSSGGGGGGRRRRGRKKADEFM